MAEQGSSTQPHHQYHARFDCANFEEFRSHFFDHFHPRGYTTWLTYLRHPVSRGEHSHETADLQELFSKCWWEWGSSHFRDAIHHDLKDRYPVLKREIGNVVSLGLGRLKERSMRQLVVLIDIMHAYPNCKYAGAVDPLFRKEDLAFLHQLGIDASNEAHEYDKYINSNTLVFAPGLPLNSVPCTRCLEVRPPMIVHTLTEIHGGYLAPLIRQEQPRLNELSSNYQVATLPRWPDLDTPVPLEAMGLSQERYYQTEFSVLLGMKFWVRMGLR